MGVDRCRGVRAPLPPALAFSLSGLVSQMLVLVGEKTLAHFAHALTKIQTLR